MKIEHITTKEERISPFPYGRTKRTSKALDMFLAMLLDNINYLDNISNEEYNNFSNKEKEIHKSLKELHNSVKKPSHAFFKLLERN